jgi:hypothetical protein
MIKRTLIPVLTNEQYSWDTHLNIAEFAYHSDYYQTTSISLFRS